MDLNCREVQRINGNKACDACKFRYECFTATDFSFDIDTQCSACKGTGVYVGMGERDGAGVVCNRCKGTGRSHIHVEWTDFRGQQIRAKVSRVYQANPGVIIGEGTNQSGEVFKLEYFGGVPYNEWLKNPVFPPKSEMRTYSCPVWWYQTVEYSKKPHWDWCKLGGTFADCDHFKDKDKCWERWDKEYGKFKSYGR